MAWTSRSVTTTAFTIDPPFSLEPGDDLRRQEMRADGDIRVVLVQIFDKRPRVESVESEAELFVATGNVEVIVEPAEHFRRHC